MIAGDPATITAGANSLLAAARAFADAADATGADAKSGTAEWDGEAALAAYSTLVNLGHRAGVGVEVCRQAAAILQEYATQLQTAQIDWLMGQAQLSNAQRQQNAMWKRGAGGSAAFLDMLPVSQARIAAQGAMDAAQQAAQDANAVAAAAIQSLIAALQEMAPTPAPQPAAEAPHHGALSTVLHTGLDVAGLVPLLGEPADGVNAIYYGLEGDKLNAGISAASMIPVFGDGIMAAKYSYRGAKAVDAAVDAEHAVDAGKALEREVPRAQLGHTDNFEYRKTFEGAHPDVDMGSTVVHHAVEQRALTRYPNTITPEQMHSAENLRGVPEHLNRELHLQAIRKEWNQFYKAYPPGTATQQQLLDFATEVDVITVCTSLHRSESGRDLLRT